MSNGELSLWQSVGRRKPIPPKQEGSPKSGQQLARTLGVWDLVGFGLGCTIGAGIFVSLGGAAVVTGVHSLFLCFVVAAMGCLGSGLSYAEMSTRIPAAGSAYSYVYTVFGELVAFQTGMLIVLGNIVSASAVARSFSNYLRVFLQDVFGLFEHSEHSILFDHPIQGTEFSISLVSFVIILLLGFLNLKGISDTSRFNCCIQCFNVSIVLFFIAVGAYYVGSDPIIPTLKHNPVNAHLGGSSSAAGAIPRNRLLGWTDAVRSERNEPQSAGGENSYSANDIVYPSTRDTGVSRTTNVENEDSTAARRRLSDRTTTKVKKDTYSEKGENKLPGSVSKFVSSKANAVPTRTSGDKLVALDEKTPSDNTEAFMLKGLRGVLRGASLVFFAFLGFDMVTTLAEEAQRPAKIVPLAIIFTVIFSCLLYVAVSLVFAGLVGTTDMVDLKAPLAHAFRQHEAPTLVTVLISVGACGNTLSTALASVVAIPRVLFKMGQDGLLGNRFCEVDPSSGVPRFSVTLSTILASLFSGFLEFEILADLVSVGALMAFTLVSAATIELRLQEDRELLGREPTNGVAVEMTTIGRQYDDGYRQGGSSKEPTNDNNLHLHDGEEGPVSHGVSVSRDLAFVAAGSLVLSYIWYEHKNRSSIMEPILGLIGTLLTFIGVMLIMHKWYFRTQTRQDLFEENFRIPLMPWPALLSIFINCYLIVGLPVHSLVQSAYFCGACMIVYVCYSRYHSQLNFTAAMPKE